MSDLTNALIAAKLMGNGGGGGGGGQAEGMLVAKILSATPEDGYINLTINKTYAEIEAAIEQGDAVIICGNAGEKPDVFHYAGTGPNLILFSAIAVESYDSGILSVFYQELTVFASGAVTANWPVYLEVEATDVS